MKTIIKLLIVAAVLNACARGAMAAWSYYQFKDATQQAILFAGDATDGQLQQQILLRAMELEVPVDPANVQVTRQGPRTVADVSYTQAVELFPSYQRPIKFTFRVDALAVNPRTPAEEPK